MKTFRNVKVGVILSLFLLLITLSIVFADYSYEPTDRNGFTNDEAGNSYCYCGPAMECFPCYERVEEKEFDWDKVIEVLKAIFSKS